MDDDLWALVIGVPEMPEEEDATALKVVCPKCNRVTKGADRPPSG